MIINNKSIPGIFIYTDNTEYEKGDFIVKNNNIYICSPKYGNTVINKDPENDLENYSVYLGNNEPATWEDFQEQFNNFTEVINNDKIITNFGLVNILKKIMFGIDSEGIIDESISPITDSVRILLNKSGNINNDPQEIIDYFILTENIPEFNNLTLKVSRDLFSSILPKVNSDDKPESKSVILRQYTYYETAEKGVDNDVKIKIRVQEVIDHVLGVCFYRYYRFSDVGTLNSLGIPSQWKLSCPNFDYLNKLNSLLNYIINNSNHTEEEINRDRFRFIELTIPSFESSSEKEKTYQFKKDTIIDNTITITISTKPVSLGNNENLILENYSMTVKVNNSIDNTEYAFPNNVLIKFLINSNDTMSLILSWGDIYDNAWITDIYARESL